ncbi:MAG: Hsp20/alpha crystallin family protein [Firmicutes bacterium]|nr:Hsp20/alpha crystallin family protein [Bacillota bacterium]
MNRNFNNLDMQTARIYMREMLDIYREVLGQGILNSRKGKGTFKPKVSLHELNDELVLLAEIPELDKNREVRVTFGGHILYLRGVIQRDGKPVPFQRQVLLPVEGSYKEKSATYQNGVLEIRLAREGRLKPQEIKVSFYE